MVQDNPEFHIHSKDLKPSSEDLEYRSEDLPAPSEKRDTHGRLLTPSLSAPVIHNLDLLSPALLAKLKTKASLTAKKKKLPKSIMRDVILSLCEEHFITRNCLAQLMNRDPDSLRQQHLKELLEEGLLRQAFPQNPTDSRQAYIANRDRIIKTSR
ncbi:hypothetical protein LZ24_00379 [Desulfobotulus alkaliphilus]|uniref:Uncharacterized protein n=1 Tax=Desulfobotulus alkaliphilus TaxID=622671 RepID=A0A562S6E5_9BACT|nr:hypothetical protein [Desulfobotulus alkaliphilus]TWI76758.1 hypothetical protein LZ24_00379 [Desulfobotulus alkaliphilus]